MDDDVKLFMAIIAAVVAIVGLMVAGWAYENHTFVTGGYCEQTLSGTAKAIWVKCAPESTGKP